MAYLKWSDIYLRPINLWSVPNQPGLLTKPGKPIKVNSTSSVNRVSSNEIKDNLYQSRSNK